MEKRGAAGGRASGQSGSASVEQVGLAGLLALLLLAAIAAVASGGDVDAGRALARAIGRKVACAPRLPDPCRRHPLVPAYGWPVARLVRSLAPAPGARVSAVGLPLAPVDFRRCRRESCAVAVPAMLFALPIELVAAAFRRGAVTELRTELLQEPVAS